MKNFLIPIKLMPIFKDYLWGGTKLSERYGKQASSDTIAESWEISTHKDGSSIIVGTSYEGRSLAQLVRDNPLLVGSEANGDSLPVLVKLIDAQDKLSLQVHPRDDYALMCENQPGKNELWYIIDAEPDSHLIMGMTGNPTKNELSQMIQNGQILENVTKIPAKAGDCYEIPAGMIHGIGGGLLIAEVQQNSNLTYRVFDYDRTDTKGNKRELHVDKALQVIDPSLKPINRSSTDLELFDGYSRKLLTDWQWFTVSELDISDHANLIADSKSFNGILLIDGEIEITANNVKIALLPSQSAFIPAGTGDYIINGKGKLLLVAI